MSNPQTREELVREIKKISDRKFVIYNKIMNVDACIAITSLTVEIIDLVETYNPK